MPSFREIRFAEKKDNIVRKAADIFAEKGYEKTTLEEIAAELKLTKGSIYHYFKGKEDILFQSLIRAHSLANEALAKVCAMPDLSPPERFTLAIKEHVKVITKKFVYATLRQQDLLLPGDMREEVMRERDKFQKRVIDLVQQGIDSGDFREADVRMVVFALLGSVNWIARWYTEEGPYDPEEIGESFAEYLLNGLR